MLSQTLQTQATCTRVGAIKYFEGRVQTAQRSSDIKAIEIRDHLPVAEISEPVYSIGMLGCRISGYAGCAGKIKM